MSPRYISRFARKKAVRPLGATLLVVALTTGTISAVAPSANAIDATIIDGKADPRTDFSRYAFGVWLDRTTIPADRPGYGTFDEVGDPLEANLLSIVQTPQQTSDGQKLNGLYAQAIDINARNKIGLKPIQKTLRQIRLSKTKKQLLAVRGGSNWLVPSVQPSLADPTVNALWVSGPGLGLGVRDAYLAKDEQSVAIQQAYIAFLAEELKFVGYAPAKAKREAAKVFALERSIAKLYLDPVALSANIQAANVSVTVAELQKLSPSTNWSELIAAANLKPGDRVQLGEPEYVKKSEALLKKTPLATMQALNTIQLLGAAGPFLSDDIINLRFSFYGRLQGQEQRSSIQRESLNQVNQLMSDALGKLYAEKFFPPAAKAEITTITSEVLTAFGSRINASAWMSPETKLKALEKLAKVKVRVAYPDRFLTYDDVTLGASYAESIQNLGKAALTRSLSQVGKPVDQTNWGPVGIVNAFYNPQDNTINFPAGILGGAFFDPAKDPASNFGAIGAVIGHELTHGFDIFGSQFDGDGRIVNWWTDADRSQFVELNKRLAAQYSALKVEGGTVNGELTVGENVADLGGVQVAFDALNARLAKSDPGPIDGLTQKQRFFIAWAQGWKEKDRPEYAKFLLTADVHSPSAVRATQPLRNMNAFMEAFGVRETDPMWVAPAERIVVW